MKEMVGGCCVCSDEHGWTENPLVYCDGQNCTVAVHQACYGIVTVPTGPWYCRKCESQERSARVRCELCPSRDGALKKTDNQGWAHVVCALYIPEVRFGNVTTMEPIILQLIPPERFAKTCYICTENSKPSRATAGACMQCNKSGCKQQFHVTCAQALGLLCEEAGNYLDNVKYCGYCQHHYSKLKKGGNVKTIPPYKPITHETGSSDSPSSPEKDSSVQNNNATVQSTSTAIPLPSSNPIKTNPQSIPSSSSNVAQIPPITTTSSSSSKQRKSSSTSKTSTSTSSSSIINNVSTSSSLTVSGISNQSSSKNNSSSTKDKEKHSKNISSSKSSSKNEKDLTQLSSSSSNREKGSKSSKSSSSSSSTSNTINKDDLSLSNVSVGIVNKIEKSSNTTVIAGATSSVKGLPNVSTNTATPPSTSSTKETSTNKLTSSTNLNESVLNITQSELPIFGSNISNSNNPNINNGENSTIKITNINIGGGGNVTSNNPIITKKRKSESGSSKSTTIDDLNKDMIKDVSVTIIPLTNLENLETIDFDKASKKSKISDANITKSNENSLQTGQNVSPNHPNIIQQQPPVQTLKHNILQTTISSGLIKPPVLKDVNDGRIQQAVTTISSFSGGGNQQNLTTQPSLVVSVPLSTAGVNIPTTNSIPTSNNQVIHQGSGLYQHMTQNRDQLTTTTSRASPIVNYQQQNHQSTMPLNIGRKSPLIQGAALSPISLISDHPPHNPVPPSTSISVLQTVSPSLPSNINSVPTSGPNVTASDSSILKISYEKQPNSRIAQLQDELPARRSSRSQSNESTKSRASKKRVATSSPSTATTSSLSIVFPVNSASTGHHTNNNNNNSNTTNINSNINNNNIISPNQYQTLIGGQPTTTPTSSSNININNNNKKISISATTRNQSNETPPPSTSRTPDTNYTTISYGGGLKFTYEAQSNSSMTATVPQQQHLQSSLNIVAPPISITPQPIKDSPPSSPGSEAGSRKRTRKSAELKNDIKIFQNGVVATHMLGNQINPASSVAQKMTDQLNMEIEAHSIYTSTSLDSGPQLIGPPYPGKSQSNSRSSSTQPGGLGSILSGSSSSSQTGNTHQSLEQLLERQWEQGSQFLMEQAQHFDIASLLSCLHQLRTENIRLEEHVSNLVARRDHLLAVNARLAIPLNPPVPPQAQGTFNNMHINGPTDIQNLNTAGVNNRTGRLSNQHFNAQQQQPQQILENGVDFRHSSVHSVQPPSTGSRHSSMSYTTTQQQSSNRQQQQQSSISVNIEQTTRNRNSSNTFQMQQSSYSTAHQPPIRPDDSQVKPS